MKILKVSVAVPFLLVAPSLALAECEVEEVIELVDEGLSRKMIREECRSVDADCSLTKVIRLAKRGNDSEEIYEECAGRESISTPGGTGGRQATICQTPYGSCAINLGYVERGQPCFCTSWQGTAYGQAR